MRSHQPLLGRLASQWFTEIIATDALRLILDDSVIRSAFLSHVGGTAGVDLSAVRSFERERVTSDGRIDLEGVDAQGRPRLVIEAKFGHSMSTQQMSKYRVHQSSALTGVDVGVLLLLVPAGRLAQASAIMAFVASTATPDQPSIPRIVPIALSWETCLDTVDDALRGSSHAGPVSPTADVAQLRAVCEALAGWATPLSEIPDVEHIEHLKVVLEQLRDQVPCRSYGPLVVRDPDYSVLRYFGVLNARPWYSIGIARPLHAAEPTPMWLRFHKKTPDFAQVKKAVRRSSLAEAVVELRGHLWFPLQVIPELAGPELVDSLAFQVAATLGELFPMTPDPGTSGQDSMARQDQSVA